MNGPVVVDTTRLNQRLNDLRRRADNMEPAFAEIGQMLLTSVERNFEEEGRYSVPGAWQGGSSKWEKLAAATVRARKRKGRGPNPILQISGQLAASVHSEPDAAGVTVGTNLVYAGIHQFGGEAGRGRSVHVPARPYLVAQDEDIDDACDIIAHH